MSDYLNVNNKSLQHHQQQARSPTKGKMRTKRPLGVSSSSGINIDDSDDRRTNIKVTASLVPNVTIETNCRRQGE